ncbi:hypothetical protein GDO81_006328 [Engystomops pustulosus]|uniref:Secreted protein n=1 Tax=Engystomops pustulosus TaxID=76066 RepID=A0AAV7CWD2_ENGPU|nr:hypothetical protein GDO81_006328 [Engystomops pustulosus]
MLLYYILLLLICITVWLYLGHHFQTGGAPASEVCTTSCLVLLPYRSPAPFYFCFCLNMLCSLFYQRHAKQLISAGSWGRINKSSVSETTKGARNPLSVTTAIVSMK